MKNLVAGCLQRQKVPRAFDDLVRLVKSPTFWLDCLHPPPRQNGANEGKVWKCHSDSSCQLGVSLSIMHLAHGLQSFCKCFLFGWGVRNVNVPGGDSTRGDLDCRGVPVKSETLKTGAVHRMASKWMALSFLREEHSLLSNYCSGECDESKGRLFRWHCQKERILVYVWEAASC